MSKEEVLDYDPVASSYRQHRKADSRIAAAIEESLAGQQTILNIGAGAGSYEPRQGHIIAIEPSWQMLKSRSKPAGLIQGQAESISLANNSVDAAMASLTIHHWQNLERGLLELKRVSRNKVVLFTWLDDSPKFWMEDYFPEIRQIDRRIFPSLDDLQKILGKADCQVIPIPADCSDGFMCAYWQRPQAYLNPRIRRAISSFSRISNCDQGIAKLQADINSGCWQEKYGYLYSLKELDLGYRLISFSL